MKSSRQFEVNTSVGKLSVLHSHAHPGRPPESDESALLLAAGQLADASGGEVALANRAEGGLDASVRLPLA